MALKTFKPYTKSTRGTVIVDKSSLWKGSSYKPLTKGQSITGGRNNRGRITSRHQGGGQKHKFRIIDFLRKKKNVVGNVERIEYDPNRTAYIALIKYEDSEMNYIICPQNIKVGDKIVFKVPSGANKKNLKNNIEKIFKVNVTKINIINKQNRTKLTRGRKVKVSGYKKAIITLKKGQSIDLTTGI